MRRWIVKVFDEHGDDYRIYSVIATTNWDARLLAFVLDKGIELDQGIGLEKYRKSSVVEWGELELTKLYTEVVEGPLAD